MNFHLSGKNFNSLRLPSEKKSLRLAFPKSQSVNKYQNHVHRLSQVNIKF